MKADPIVEVVHSGPAVSVVVCGTGSIGMRHLQVLRNFLHLDPVALPTRSARVPELQAAGIRTVESWQLVRENPPKFAIIATDTSRHLADATVALELGAHVLVEKPIAIDASGLNGLAELAAARGCQVFVACVLRFDAGLLQFQRHLPEIGRVHSVRIECQSFLPEWRPGTDYRQAYSARQEEGGVLRDLIHEIDYAMWLYGPPSELFARLGNSGTLGIKAEESADLLWETPSGASVSIRLDYLSRIPRRRMCASGELGDLEWDYFQKNVTLSLAGKHKQIWTTDQKRDEMMRDQTTAFLAIEESRAPSAVASLEDGALAISICDAARRSSQSKRVEQVLDWRKL
jgi:predicted dehydrogenase